MNNKNTIIGLAVMFLIMITWSYWMSPSKEELQKQQRITDSITKENKIRQDSANALMARKKILQEEKTVQQKEVGNLSDTVGAKRKILHDQLGAFTGSADDAIKFYTIESDLVKIKISTRGGKIDYVELKKYKSWDGGPLVLINKDSSDFGFTFFSNNRIINTNKLFFKPVWMNPSKTGDSLITIKGKDSVQFAMRLYADVSDSVRNKEKYIEFIYTIHGDQYMIGFTVNFAGMSDIIDPGTKYLVLNWDSKLKRQEKSLKMEQMNSTVYYKFYEDKVDYLSETKDEEKYLKNEKVQWISFKQQFFSTTLIAGTHFTEPKNKNTLRTRE